MPPKKNKRGRTSESSTSRTSSPSSESRQDEAAHPTKHNKAQSTTVKLSHTVDGKLTRPAWARECVAEKKSESDIWSTVVPFERATTDDDFDPATMLKIVTWNVAGLRGMLKKNEQVLREFVQQVQPDVLCLQETKLNCEDADKNTALGVLDGYSFVDHPCRCKKGYSGTRTYTHNERVAQSHCVRTTRGFTLWPNHSSEDGVIGKIDPDSRHNSSLEQTNESQNSCSYSSANRSSNSNNNSDGADKSRGLDAVVDDEGRVLTTLLTPMTLPHDSSATHEGGLAGPALAIVNTYIPNSGMTLNRLSYRTDSFDARMRQYLTHLNDVCGGTDIRSSDDLDASSNTMDHNIDTGRGNKLSRSVTKLQQGREAMPLEAGIPGGFIWTGDLNVAERDFDRYYAENYQTMQSCSGFTPEERYSFRQTLKETGAVDVFRALYPCAAPAYTFWSARINGRARGLGWRLDYFVASAALAPRVVDCFPMPHVMGSDHCPVQLWLRRL